MLRATRPSLSRALVPPYSPEDYHYVWSEGFDCDDRATWLHFLEIAETWREQIPDPVVIHYSHYEVTQIRTYATRYEMNDHPTVQWLLGDDTPMFDISRTIREALVLPLSGYGLKKICREPNLVGFNWQLEESGSQWSVVKYHRYQASVDDQQRAELKNSILSYNRDDVRAMEALCAWLSQFEIEHICRESPAC